MNENSEILIVKALSSRTTHLISLCC